MDVRLRIQTCRLIEQMDKQPEATKHMGLENASVFCGEREKYIVIRRNNKHEEGEQ